MFRAIAARDGGCRYPGCDRPVRFCDAHHIRHWRHGGNTDHDNLVLLCSRHHHHVHKERLQLKLLPDATVDITWPDGTPNEPANHAADHQPPAPPDTGQQQRTSPSCLSRAVPARLADSSVAVMSGFDEGCAWIRGEFVPVAEATISVLDAGFSRSDVTYDVVGVWDGAFFRLDDHLDRFEQSWHKLKMNPPIDKAAMREILIGCVARSGLREAYVEMIVTRGVPRGGSRDPRTYENRFYAYAIPYVWIIRPDDQLVGTHLVVSQTTQRIPANSVDPTVKNFHWGDLSRGLFEAYERGAVTAVLPDADGNITEGPGFNVFARVDGTFVTPSSGVLEGITRRTVLELAADLGIPARLGTLAAADLHRADEIFLTSTAGGVMPVATVDDRPVGSGEPGPRTMQLRNAYWGAHRDPRYATPVSYDR